MRTRQGPDDFNGYGYFFVRLYCTGLVLQANIGIWYIHQDLLVCWSPEAFSLLVPNASVTQKYCSSQVTVQHEVCRLHPQRAVHHVVLSPSTTVFQLINERTAKKQTECCQPSARSQVFPQQADCDGNALVCEFMVAFLLIFTVLRTAVNSDFVYDRPPTLRLTLRIHVARRVPRSSLHGSCVRLKALSS